MPVTSFLQFQPTTCSFFYKHIKIRKQAQRCLGRELNKAEKMLEGCLYPNMNFSRMLTKDSESGSKYA